MTEGSQWPLVASCWYWWDHVIPIPSLGRSALPQLPSFFFSKGWKLGGSAEVLLLSSCKGTTLGQPFLPFTPAAHNPGNTLGSPKELPTTDVCPCPPSEKRFSWAWVYIFTAPHGFQGASRVESYWYHPHCTAAIRNSSQLCWGWFPTSGFQCWCRSPILLPSPPPFLI